jgi:hypothetical protein
VVSGGKVEIRNVDVPRDLGPRADVDSRANASDQVILNPPINLVQRGAAPLLEPAATDRQSRKKASRPRALSRRGSVSMIVYVCYIGISNGTAVESGNPHHLTISYVVIRMFTKLAIGNLTCGDGRSAGQ